MSDHLRLGATFLYSGYVKLNRAGDGIEPEPQSVEPLRNIVLVAPIEKKPTKGAQGSSVTELTPWISGPDGLLRPLSGLTGNERGMAIRYWDDKTRTHLIPSSVVLNAWAAAGARWPEELAKAIQKKLGVQSGMEIREVRVKKRHLRPPDRKSDDPDEKAYAASYDKMTDASPPNAGLVLPKIRAVVLVFSDLRFAQKWLVTLTPPKGGKPVTRTIAQDPDTGLVTAVPIGTERDLPAGLYKVEVRLEDASNAAAAAAAGGKTSYTLHEMIYFRITNVIGDLDVVCCDPISVEEAVMAQFPVLYEHRTKVAARRAFHPDTEVEARSFPAALKPWCERIGWAHAKAKLAISVVNADGSNQRAKLLGKAIWRAIEARDKRLAAMKQGVDFAFGLSNTVKEWGELIKAIKAEKEGAQVLKSVKQLLWSHQSLSTFERYRFYKYAKQEYVDKKLLVFDLKDAAQNETVLRAGIPRKRTNLQKAVGTRTGKGIEKSVAAVGTALEVLNVALAFNELFAAKEGADEMSRELDQLLRQVDSVLSRGASREGLGNLERMRTATVAAKLGVEAAEGQALMAAVDLALGALTMVGIGGPALALVVLVKSTAGLVVDAGEAFDRHVLGGVVRESLARELKRYELARSSRMNQELMPERVANGGEDDLRAQFLLRAEALTGLVRLLMRAGMFCGSAAAFQKHVRDLDIEGYVKHVLLGEGWQFPVKPLIPIGMDSVWLQLRGHYLKELATTEIGELLGYTNPLALAPAAVIPGGMVALATLDRICRDNLVARYQRTFPIHRMDAAQVEDLATAFRTSWPELEKENLAYTCIYHRPRGSTDDKAWEPVNAAAARDVDALPLLSPYEQIRVLLVMKGVKDGQYPVTFNLLRVDGWNVKGPSYKEILKPLDPHDLLEHEQGFKGSVGCVLYPFYCFGPQTIPGIKPVVSDLWRGMDRLPRYLDDMRYSFEIVLGRDGGGTYLDIGGQAGKRAGLDEFRVGFTHQPDEDKLLTMSFLARQGQDAEYPPVFIGMSGAEPIYARVGEAAPYALASPEDDANLVFASFNWRDPVEFVVVVWADRTAHTDAEAEEHEWDRVNVKMQLVNFVGLVDQDGPTYESTLEFVGMLRKPLGGGTPTLEPRYEQWRGSVKHAHPVRGTGKGVQDWTRQIAGNPMELRKLALAVDPAWEAKMVEYQLYAAHFRLDYYTPDARHVYGLRPFGKLLTNRPGRTDEYYRIGIRNIQQTSGADGKTWEKSRAPRASAGIRAAVRQEYEFHFRAPVPGDPAPWGDLRSPAVVEWITKQARVRDPRIRLLAEPSA